jgi:hypothetical protein
LAALKRVTQALKAAPVPDPGADFWESFNRQLHLQLAHLTPAPQPPRPFFRSYYLLGAPALVLVLILVFSRWGLSPGPLVTARAPAPPQATVAAQGAAEPAPGQVFYVGMDDGVWQGEEVPSWDVEAVMADLTQQERDAVLKKIDY